jgi:hypothetical protein
MHERPRNSLVHVKIFIYCQASFIAKRHLLPSVIYCQASFIAKRHLLPSVIYCQASGYSWVGLIRDCNVRPCGLCETLLRRITNISCACRRLPCEGRIHSHAKNLSRHSGLQNWNSDQGMQAGEAKHSFLSYKCALCSGVTSSHAVLTVCVCVCVCAVLTAKYWNMLV